MADDKKHLTEEELRDLKPEWPNTIEELTTFIEGLVNQKHDYGTCVYAMSLAAVAAFHYVAGKLGVTGFQASMADLDILKRTRHLDGPFMLLDGSQALYPQYDLRAKVEEFLTSDSTKAYLKDAAAKKLDDPNNGSAHPDVVRHWKHLAGRE